MTDHSVMLIGPGDLGAVAAEFLARSGVVARLILAGRDEAKGTACCNLARVGAIAQGCATRIEFARVDLDRPSTVAEAVAEHEPAVIVTTVTVATWWLRELLPAEARDRIKSAGFGAWLPVNLAPTMKLMRALSDVEYVGVTLVAPYPDVACPILARMGIAPTCGVGNVHQVASKVKALAAERLEVPIETIDVTLVAHHALGGFAYRGLAGDIPPYFLRIEADGADMTEQVSGGALLTTPYPLPGGSASHRLTAGSIVGLTRAFLGDEPTRTHAPAPNGLPGGYPVIIGAGCIEPAPIDGLSLEEAIDINERSQVFDGIERLEADGTAVFTERAAGVMREVLGYDCPRLRPGEIEDRARELVARFREYAGRHDVEF